MSDHIDERIEDVRRRLMTRMDREMARLNVRREQFVHLEVEVEKLRKQVVHLHSVLAVACGLSLALSVCALFWAVWGGE